MGDDLGLRSCPLRPPQAPGFRGPSAGNLRIAESNRWYYFLDNFRPISVLYPVENRCLEAVGMPTLDVYDIPPAYATNLTLYHVSAW